MNEKPVAEHNDTIGPWWVKLFLQVGFPTALAIVLVAALLGWMPTPMMEKLTRIEYQGWQQIMIMRVMCYSLTREKDHRACEPWKTQE